MDIYIYIHIYNPGLGNTWEPSWGQRGRRANVVLGCAGIKEYSDWPTIPQLYVDKDFVGGCDILVSMHQNGELAKMLEEKKVLAAAEEGESAQ